MTLNPAQFIHDLHYGVLSTHSQSEQGYPFGSITPYIISANGDIAIFISHLAEHSHNIQANSKVSLTIFDPTDANNPSTGARITCLANAEITDDDKKKVSEAIIKIESYQHLKHWILYSAVTVLFGIVSFQLFFLFSCPFLLLKGP